MLRSHFAQTNKHKLYYMLLTFSMLSTAILTSIRLSTTTSILPLEEESFQSHIMFESIFIAIPILIVYIILFNILKNESFLHIASFLLLTIIYISILGSIAHITLSFLFASYSNELIFLFTNLIFSLLGFIIFSIILYRLSGNYTKKLTPDAE